MPPPTTPVPGQDNELTKAVHRVGNFWERVSDGLEIQTLWSQFFSEARASYGMYSREVDWDALRNETRFHRFMKISRTLFWAMLIKLSPARRVFLLIVLVVLGLFVFNIRPGGVPREATFIMAIAGLDISAGARTRRPCHDEARPGNRAGYPALAGATISSPLAGRGHRVFLAPR